MKKEEILIGKTLDEAAEILRNCKWRIVINNGAPRIVTCDFKPERYNLYIDNDKITKVTFG